MTVHPSAIIGDGVHLGCEAVVGPYTNVEPGAVVGEKTELASHVVVRANSVIGREVIVDSFAVIGGTAQTSVSSDPAQGRVSIGMGAVLREGVTVHRSIRVGHATAIGRETLLMPNSHVGHDCRVGGRVVLANNAMLAAYVEVHDHATIGGGAAIHSRVRIGEGAMIAGNASISLDVPPFALAGGRNVIYGIDTAGLLRRGADEDVAHALKRCYRELLCTPGDPSLRARASLARRVRRAPELTRFLEFVSESRHGLCRAASSPAARQWLRIQLPAEAVMLA